MGVFISLTGGFYDHSALRCFELEILLFGIYPRKSYTDVHRVLYKDVHHHVVYITQMLVTFTLYFENQKRLSQILSFGGPI